MSQLNEAGTPQTHLWVPVVGPETESVVSQIPDAERPTLLEETQGILASCVPPDADFGQRTGLVVGYVQSGKTLSFTAVSALAHDNGFRLVIVIAGTSKNLLHQATNRLLGDLDAEGFWGRWQIYRSDDPDLRKAVADGIQTQLERWDDPEVDDEEKQTVLISVMKERSHLDRLIRVLAQLDLAGVPALIIDDEADQASLNIAIRKGQESQTYRRILQIRSLLPRHTFLQYTATPQAVLLINLIDQLSPDFGKVLTPGGSYTGGQTFFAGGLGLVRPIPVSDIPSDSVVLTEPPESLIQALRLFFIGVAAGMANRYSDVRNRSMMIHPTFRTDSHVVYAQWVRSIQNHWGQILALESEHVDRIDLLEEFRTAYDDLVDTVGDLIPFDQVVRRLSRSIRETRVEELNARGGTTPHIPWKRNYSWILVGGQGLDRGFTVEGLTVTYMPRSIGVGNADTVQQRARWFGYKAAYLGFCRVFLPNDVIGVYEDYVEHEEDVRDRLIEHLASGKSLKNWKRAFLLSGALSPTRRNVIGHDITQGNYVDRWFSPRSPHVSPASIATNRLLIEHFAGSVLWQQANDDPQLLNSHRHAVAPNVPLQEVYERLLLEFTYAAPADSLDFTGILLQVNAYLKDNPAATCTIYRMRPTETTARGTDDEGEEISQLFQGAYPVDGDPKIYPGDRHIRSEADLTIQIHWLDVYHGPVSQGDLLEERVPVLAVYMPSEYSAAWVVQQQTAPT